MNILIVRKSTNFELHGQRLQKARSKGLLQKHNQAELRKAHGEHYRCLDKLEKILSGAGLHVQIVGRKQKWPIKYKPDAIITVGGDGTLLFASHKIKANIPVIGIRSSQSSVGHLCAFSFLELNSFFKKFSQSSIQFQKRYRAQARVLRGEKHGSRLSPPVLNDILFANANPASTTRYKITLDHKNETHKSSGIWIATATGSTAGIFAAGGRRMSPSSALFQFRIRELFSEPGKKHHLVGKCFAVEENFLSIENLTEQAILAFDGQHGTMKLGYGDLVEIIRGPNLLLASKTK